MGILAIAILVIVGLVVIIGSIRKRKLLINKGVVILVLIGIGLFIFDSHFNNDDQEFTYYQQIAPNTVDAPYMLITDTRTYYVSEWYENERYFTLQRFWYFDKDEWEQGVIPLKFDKSLAVYADLQILKRGG